MSAKTIAYASIEYNGGLPRVAQGMNIASIIDHGPGELEVVFERPISHGHIPWITTFNNPVYVDHEPSDFDGQEIGSLLFTIKACLDGKPTDSNINILILGSNDG